MEAQLSEYLSGRGVQGRSLSDEMTSSCTPPAPFLYRRHSKHGLACTHACPVTADNLTNAALDALCSHPPSLCPQIFSQNRLPSGSSPVEATCSPIAPRAWVPRVPERGRPSAGTPRASLYLTRSASPPSLYLGSCPPRAVSPRRFFAEFGAHPNLHARRP